MHCIYMEVQPLFNQENYQRAFSFLDEHRKEKVNAAKLEKSKVHRLAAGLLLSYGVLLAEKGIKTEHTICRLELFSLLADMEKEEGFWWEKTIETKETLNGKPYFANRENLFFSMSHSEDYVVLALSECEVGVDIQKWKPVYANFVKRFLHEKELDEVNLGAVSDFAKPSGFESSAEITDTGILKGIFDRWTAKEAFVKYTGEGLGKDFRQLFTDDLNHCVTDTVTQVSLPLTQMQIVPGYSLSICTDKPV